MSHFSYDGGLTTIENFATGAASRMASSRPATFFTRDFPPIRCPRMFSNPSKGTEVNFSDKRHRRIRRLIGYDPKNALRSLSPARLRYWHSGCPF